MLSVGPSALIRGSRLSEGLAVTDPDRKLFGGLGGGFKTSSVWTKTTEFETEDGFLLSKNFGGLGGTVASDGSYSVPSV